MVEEELRTTRAALDEQVRRAKRRHDGR
jgi:hypothetical protein